MNMTTIAVTGATGELGKIAVELLLKSHPEITVVAGARDPAKAAPLAALGAVVRELDYDRPETLGPALAGVDKLLLISGNAVGQRVPQHRAVIEAAKGAGIKLLAYTSVLRAGETALAIATEHKATEEVLAQASVPHVLLRNGWYCENYLFRLQAALEHGALAHCAGDGRISAAARRDYAEGAVAVLTSHEDQAGKIYELAGSNSFTMADLAAEFSRQSGKTIAAINLSQEAFIKGLVDAGLPDFIAALIAKSDHGASEGGLFDDSRTLERLIGPPTTPMASVIAEMLKD
jgi:NAD(P)H dehydrogenase (quinone)